MQQDARSSDSGIHTGIIAREAGDAGHILQAQRCRTRCMDKLTCYNTSYMKIVIRADRSPRADGGGDLPTIRPPAIRRGERSVPPTVP